LNWRYHNPDSGVHTTQLAHNARFKDTFLFEKFLLDFELHYQLQSKIDMIVRGGMGALLYANKDSQRLSEDIDVITTMPKSEVASTVEGFSSRFDDVKFILGKEGGRISNNLLQYKVKCPSPFRKACNVSIDFLCGVDPRIAQYARVLTSPTVISVDFTHNVSVLSRGALIADKMCTMSSSDTIGLKHMHDFPKQIYDLSALLRTSNLEDLQTLFPAYMHFVGFLSKIYHKFYTVQAIVNGAPETCSGLLDPGAKSLVSARYDAAYKDFQHRYLGYPWKRLARCQLDEILLVVLCSAHLREYMADADIYKHSTELHSSIAEYNALVKENVDPVPADSARLGRLGCLQNVLPDNIPLSRAQWHLLEKSFVKNRVGLGTSIPN